MQGCSNTKEETAETTSGGSGASEGDRSESGSPNSIDAGDTDTHSKTKRKRKGKNDKSSKRVSATVDDHQVKFENRPNARTVSESPEERRIQDENTYRREAAKLAEMEHRKKLQDKFDAEREQTD